MVVSETSEENKTKIPLLTLASSSVHRQSLLQLLGIDFLVHVPHIDEDSSQHVPSEYAKDVAWQKLVATKPFLRTRLALTADTVVTLDGEIIGKPANIREARRTLGKLSGQTHQVHSAFVLWDNTTQQHMIDCSSTEVRMLSLSDSQIAHYLSWGEWKNVAGAYRIQGRASAFITDLKGSYTGVVGLPLHMLYNKLLSYYTEH